jgi:mannose-6-phosphate isomerase-like protein (cupin superfamily)
MRLENRRVVTGLDAEGRSCVVFDGPPPVQKTAPDRPGYASALLWETREAPARNDGAEDAGARAFSYRLEPGGTAVLMFRQPGMEVLRGLSEEEVHKARHGGLPKEYQDRALSAKPGMHATDTVDYVVVVEGEITLMLDAGEVTLKAGDVLIDRGVAHAWENRGERSCLMVTVMVDAVPLR